MPSNKVAAITLVGLFALQLVPAPAAAQPTGADLEVVNIDVPRAVVDKDSKVFVTVKNVGGSTFTSDTGWQIYFSWNGDTECIDKTDNGTLPTTAACYQRFDRNHPYSNPGIRAGESRTFEFVWRPTEYFASSSDPTQSDRMNATIMTYGATPGDTFTPAPDSNAANNKASFLVHVKDPSVRARPVRDLPPNPPNAHINQPWDDDDVRANECMTTAAGDATPPINEVGCMVGPGKLVTFAYLVENKGNFADTFTGSIVDTSGAQTNVLARGYKFFLVPESFRLEPGDNQTVLVQILVPEHEAAYSGINNQSLHAKVRWTSDLNNAVTTNSPCGSSTEDQQLTRNGLCQDPSLPSILASVRHDVWVGSNTTWYEVFPGNPQKINLTVNNTGNYEDTYWIYWDRAVSTVNDSWIPANATSNITIDDRALGIAEFTIRPPLNATRGIYKLDLVAQSTLDPEGAKHNFTYTIELKPRYELAGDALTRILRVVPDETATFTVFVDNNGNAPDNVTLTLENVPAGWPNSISSRQFTIPAFSRQLITLSVTPPPNTINGTSREMFINVTSQGLPNQRLDERSRVNIMVNLTVLRGPNIKTTTPVDTSFIDPQQTRTFEVLVQNTGNVEDNFTITYERQDPSWVVTTEPEHMVLKPLETGTLRVTLRAPGGAEVGESTKVFTTIRSKVDPTRFKTLNFTGRISGPDLFVENIGFDRQNLYEGEDVELSVTVGNRGNKAPSTNATLRVEYLKDGVPTIIGEQISYAPEQLPGGLRKTEKILWNTSGIDGPVILRVRIDPDNLVQEIEESTSSNEVTRAATIRIFDIQVTPAQPLSGRPGEEVSYSEPPTAFVIQYRGNQPHEPVSIVIESENGWGRATFDQRLTPFNAVVLPVTLRIPSEPGVAEDTLRITVTPTLRPESVISATTTTSVIDERPPRFLDVSVTPESVTLNESVTFNALVRDETGIREVRAYVVRPGDANETETVVLGPTGDGRFTASKQFDAAGTYRYYLVAVDGSDAANRNTTAEVVRTFRVTPGSAPTIELATNQSTTIRTGAPIRLSITDPLGVAKANYTIRGITYELERPFNEIDTSSFAAGTIDLLVAAENVYGAASTARFSFVVDNTPPTIRRVSMEPSEPKANEATIIRVETDQDAASVEIAIRVDDKLVETRSATRRAGGVWELEYAPAQGQNDLDVTVKDAAGNAETKAGALSFRAGTAGIFGIPGFDVALALAAIGLALLARRRRA